MNSDLNSINQLLSSYDTMFNGSKDWSQSDTIGKIDWLLRAAVGLKQEVDLVWEMLEIQNIKHFPEISKHNENKIYRTQ